MNESSEAHTVPQDQFSQPMRALRGGVSDPVVSDAEQALLGERLTDLASDPDAGQLWSEVERNLRRRL